MENKGKLILVVTCAPADIKHPKDVDLLNDSRASTDNIIDKLYETIAGTVTKPRTDKHDARTRYPFHQEQKNSKAANLKSHTGTDAIRSA